MIKQRLFIMICCLFLLTESKAQIYNYTHYTTSDGLSNSCVYGLYQDRSGFLWITTEFGLNCFDGKQFRTYDISDGLPENTLISITEGTPGHLLFGTVANGVGEFSKKKEFRQLTETNQVHKLFYRDSLLFSYSPSAGNADIYNFRNRKTYHFYTKISKDSFTNSITPIAPQTVLVATKNGFSTFNPDGKCDYTIHRSNTGADILSNMTKGFVWFAKGSKFYKLDVKKHEICDSLILPEKKHIKVRRMFVDSKDRIWFSTTFPISFYCIYKQGNTIKTENVSTLLGMDYVEVNDIIEDREHNIWIGTYNKGIYCIQNTFLYYNPAFKNMFINSIYADRNGNHYINAYNGINIYKPSTNTTHIVPGGEQQGYYHYGFCENKDRIFAPANMSGNIHPLGKINNKEIIEVAGRYFLFVNDTLTLKGNWTSSVCLSLYKKGHLSLSYKPIALAQKLNTSNRVIKLYKDSSGKIWCGADQGLYIVDPFTCQSKKIESPEFQFRVTDILEHNNILWVGTEKHLVKYTNQKTEVIEEISGVKLGKITGLAKDGKNRLYIGTFKGLFILDGNHTVYLNDKSGLRTNEINAIAYDSVNKAILVASNDSYSQIMLEEYERFQKTPLTIYIKSLTSGDSIYETSDHYILNAGSNGANLNYVAINLTYPQSVIYRYQTDNSSWIHTRSDNIVMAGLAYGKHEIRIQASLDDKTWSPPSIVSILVPTPYYASWWFITIVLLAGISLTFYIVRRRIRHIRQKSTEKLELQKQLDDLKFKSLNTSINPHFIFNALNSIQHYINGNDKKKASDYLGRFARLIRLILDYANEKEILVSHEIERLHFYMQLEQNRFDHQFTYTIEADPGILNTLIPNMIVQPLVENAVLHGIKNYSQGKIEIRFRKNKTSIFIEVEDNGSGLHSKPGNAETNHKSLALANIRERLKLYPGSVFQLVDKQKINSGAHGVLACIEIPINSTGV